ncbi:MAG: bifunctional folylpolyglutamate synthase/dihydrofolate synthase [Oscillospiraceae bacterium]|nr:bifunctional folylpolyglutamate synthase/dihydrofolate synthase [Oscillospiraceae bacterium]
MDITNLYNKTLNYIHSLGMYSNPPHIDLSKMKYLCNIFGNPQDSYMTVHIAGTNGKGSTAAMLANILRELGYKTGRYISPYIEEFTERISINGGDISRDELVFYAEKIQNALAENNAPDKFMPNEFEFVTLLAFIYYRAHECDIAVIETGLGGRLDPTNVIKSPLASVITSISLDHMQVLGDTVEKIAVEKCGIIKQNRPVVLYPLNGESVIKIVENTAKERNCEFIIPDVNSLKIVAESLDCTQFEYKNKPYKIKLAGRHQIYNAVTVIETIMRLFRDKTNIYDAIYNGIEKTFFPARFEILSKKPLLIFDGAHNISGVNALCDTIKNLLIDKYYKKIILICGMLKDKKPEEAIKNICSESFVEKFIAVPVNSMRSENPENLCEYASKYCKNAEYSYDLSEALESALDEALWNKYVAVVCFGSLYLAGDVKKAWDEYNKYNKNSDKI